MVDTTDNGPLISGLDMDFIWVRDGKIELANIHPRTQLMILSLISQQFTVDDGGRYPILASADETYLWGDSEGFHGPLIDGRLTLAQASAAFQPRQSKTTLPLRTDGGSLYAWRAKLARIDRGEAVSGHLALLGDSWHEYGYIPNEFRSLLQSEFGNAGLGWISANPATDNLRQSGYTLTASGWTVYDASATLSVSAVGTGIDGQAISATGTALTATLTIPDDSLKIYYHKGDGTLRYRVNGGAWQTVTGDGTGGLGIVSLTGLGAGTNTIEFDLNGNAGTAAIRGFFSYKVGAKGVIVSKAGNAGMRGINMMSYAATQIQAIAADIGIDVAKWALGTNDYIYAESPPSTTIAGIDAAVASLRSANPNIGTIVMAPAQSNRTAVVPLSSYRDALYQYALTNGFEFDNAYDRWGPFSAMDALGLWRADGVHPDEDAGREMASSNRSGLLGK